MLSRLSQLQNRRAKAETQHLTTRRGLFGTTILVAAAGAATDGQDQRLDIPWEGIAVASQQRVRDVTEHASHDPTTLYRSLEDPPLLCRRRWSIEISDASAGERIVVDSRHDLHVGSHCRIGH